MDKHDTLPRKTAIKIILEKAIAYDGQVYGSNIERLIQNGEGTLDCRRFEFSIILDSQSRFAKFSHSLATHGPVEFDSASTDSRVSLYKWQNIHFRILISYDMRVAFPCLSNSVVTLKSNALGITASVYDVVPLKVAQVLAWNADKIAYVIAKHGENKNFS